APARDPGVAPHLLRLSAGDPARAQGDAGGAAGPRDPGAAGRTAPAVRGVLDGVPNGRRAPRERPEALRGERAARGAGPGAVRADCGCGRWGRPGGTRTR